MAVSPEEDDLSSARVACWDVAKQNAVHMVLIVDSRSTTESETNDKVQHV